jgi:membrane peptidoglycan carboxypeptidase
MARAYSTFANNGNRVDGSVLGNVPRAITQIGKNKNAPVGHRVLSPTRTAILNSILQKVVTEGTGHRAALGDRPVAGKTGTTENYGDAWFVGYVPQLTVAVWVGYPRALKPMETEYHGDPVAGGTFPADIWHTFMKKALPYLHDQPESFPSTYIPYGSPHEAVLRDGTLQLDNGRCHFARTLLFFDNRSQVHRELQAERVDVPDLVGQPVAAARQRLAAAMTPSIVYKVAPGRSWHRARSEAEQRAVVGVRPRDARRGQADTDRPAVDRAPVDRARKCERRGLKVDVEQTDKGPPGHVIFQLPRAGVAAAPGMHVRIAVAA